MARRRNPPELVRTKWELADRLRAIRTEMFGERGLAELAKQIGVPVRTWYSYETGVTVPAEVILRFIELTRVEPLWLLHGKGEKFQVSTWSSPPARSTADPDSFGDEPVHFTEVLGSEAALGETFGSDADPGEHVGFSAADAGAMAVALAAPPRAIRTATEPHQQTATRPFIKPCCCVRMEGQAMAPIIAPGAFVAYDDAEEDHALLEGKLVLVRFNDRILVRWFHMAGPYALLRAENPMHKPRTELIDLSIPLRIRRVLWIGTGH